ncbi:uncharacterized protein YjlB [Microvirga flocculans]|uniref:Uncharacterized protein YjlB n=1 Tax=Microvirga flocculans TaxID=217168 RepID=A0A7W6ID13_9HYPH|nr:cupin domain-containing protein [Microvirga flocculans]MBB4039201.1 uncharacterized protein YjlB [Microvirga flocculans]
MAQAKGYGDRQGYNAPLGTQTYIFRDNGIVPNSPLPLIVRRGAVSPSADDPAMAFETVFAGNGWTHSWRNGIYQFHHYHPNTHEVLGVYSGSAQVRFGGEDGELVSVSAGDVMIVPAGVAHALVRSSDDFAVVGAYPDGADYDTVRDDPQALDESRRRIAKVPLPDADPVDGTDGPLMRLWA